LLGIWRLFGTKQTKSTTTGTSNRNFVLKTYFPDITQEQSEEDITQETKTRIMCRHIHQSTPVRTSETSDNFNVTIRRCIPEHYKLHSTCSSYAMPWTIFTFQVAYSFIVVVIYGIFLVNNFPVVFMLCMQFWYSYFFLKYLRIRSVYRNMWTRPIIFVVRLSLVYCSLYWDHPIHWHSNWTVRENILNAKPCYARSIFS
jgi:hypothetical protein